MEPKNGDAVCMFTTKRKTSSPSLSSFRFISRRFSSEIQLLCSDRVDGTNLWTSPLEKDVDVSKIYATIIYRLFCRRLRCFTYCGRWKWKRVQFVRFSSLRFSRGGCETTSGSSTSGDGNLFITVTGYSTHYAWQYCEPEDIFHYYGTWVVFWQNCLYKRSP